MVVFVLNRQVIHRKRGEAPSNDVLCKTYFIQHLTLLCYDCTMFYVYVIQNKHGELYVGATNNLQRRIFEHTSHQNISTKNSTWNPVYYEAYRQNRRPESRTPTEVPRSSKTMGQESYQRFFKAKLSAGMCQRTSPRFASQSGDTGAGYLGALIIVICEGMSRRGRTLGG